MQDYRYYWHFHILNSIWFYTCITECTIVFFNKPNLGFFLLLFTIVWIFQVLGLNTNIQFLMDLARHPEFEAARVHTDFIPQYNDQLFPVRTLSDKTICQAAIALLLIEQEKIHHQACSTLGSLKYVNTCITMSCFS